MRHDTFTIEFDDNDGWATLLAADEQHSFHAPAGFTIDDVISAVLATGWAERRGSMFVLIENVSGQRLADVVAGMFAYFDGPNLPTRQLLDVQRAVVEFDITSELSLSPWHHAWLDLMVREDIADAAGSAENLWSAKTLTIDVEERIINRIEQLARRTQSTAEAESRAPLGGRMAASERSRSSVARERTNGGSLPATG